MIMRKNVIAIISATMIVLPVVAQTPEIKSNMAGEKLNFEAPLFGVTAKNVKPQWSVVAFGEVNLGYSHALHVPEVYNTYQATTATGEKVEVTDAAIGLRPGGLYGDLSLLELRFRPWRNGNLFTMGLNLGFESHYLRSSALFNKDNEPVYVKTVGASIGVYSERFLSLELGYVHEAGDWSFGFQLLPGLGYSQYTNNYNASLPFLIKDEVVLQLDAKYAQRQDHAIGALGFRFGARASVWYRKFGVFVSYRPANTSYRGGPEYTTISTGLTIRY